MDCKSIFKMHSDENKVIAEFGSKLQEGIMKIKDCCDK